MSDQDYQFRLRKGAAGGPLLVALHGTGGDENQFFDFASRLIPDATVVSPRGDVSEYGAARFFRRTGEGVYDMADLARATRKMAAFIAAQKAEAGAGEVIAFGYSNGANILASVLFEVPDVVDRAALLHPLIPFQPKPNAELSGRRVLITAGRQDPICPAPLTQRLSDYFEAQAAQTELVWHPGGHELRQVEVEALGRFLGVELPA